MIEPNIKTIAITIDEGTLRRIDKVAREKGRSVNRSRFIREAVQDYLARLERIIEEEREREIVHRHRHRLHREAMALIKEQAKL